MTFLEAINVGLRTRDHVANAKREVSPMLAEVDEALRAATENSVGLSVQWTEQVAHLTIYSGRCQVDFAKVRFGPLGWPLNLETSQTSTSATGPGQLRQALTSLLAQPSTGATVARAKAACRHQITTPFREHFEGYIPCRLIHPQGDGGGDSHESSHSYLLLRDGQKVPLGYCIDHAYAMDTAKRLGYYPMEWNTSECGVWYDTLAGGPPRSP